MAKSVTIELTELGWKTIVENNGNTHIEEHIFTHTGAKGLNLLDEDEIGDELYNALCNGFVQYEIATALKNS